MSKEKENERKQCPTCAREVKEFWNYCVRCGTQLREEVQFLSQSRPFRTE